MVQEIEPNQNDTADIAYLVTEICRHIHKELGLHRKLTISSEKNQNNIVNQWYKPALDMLIMCGYHYQQVVELATQAIKDVATLRENGKTKYVPRTPANLIDRVEGYLADDKQKTLLSAPPPPQNSTINALVSQYVMENGQ